MLQSVRESILFLALARNTICEMVEFLEEADVDHKKELTDYIQNEASDYEIIHMLVTEDIPEEKYDIVKEEVLWEIFRRSIVHDLPLLSEYIDHEVLETVIFDLGSVTALSLSSAAPLREARADEEVLASEENFEKFLEEKGENIAAAKGMAKTSKKYFKDKWKEHGAGLKAGAKGSMKDAKAFWKKAGKSYWKYAKTSGAGDDMTEGTTTDQFKKDVRTKIEKGARSIKKTAKQSGKDISTFAKTGTGKAVGAVAAASLVAYAGSKVWKNFLSKAARACRGKPDKAACIKAYRRTHAPKKA